MARRPVIITALVTLPLGVLTLGLLISYLPRFFDPCVQWGLPEGPSFHAGARIGPPGQPGEEPCRYHIGTSETKAGAVTRLALVHGGILLGILLGLAGAMRSRMPLLTAAAWIIFLESFPTIFSIAPLCIFVAAMLLGPGVNAG